MFPLLPYVYRSLLHTGEDLKAMVPLERQIDTSTRRTQAEPKNSLGSLSLGSNPQTIVHTGRKRAPLHDEETLVEENTSLSSVF